LNLPDHGKVFVADLPQLSDGQLENICREARQVFESLQRRITELEQQLGPEPPHDDGLIRACTKRDVTERFLRSIAQEQSRRNDNARVQAAASESLARTFLEVARHRLPGATFDSLLQEALAACEPPPREADSIHGSSAPDGSGINGNGDAPLVLPVVLSPDL
jgi:hypothetical protein